ncbi:MAG: 4Fe-4S binding protein [Deltaproteobacteria bacterium]|nr:4Fe-4S binding protein [Deltaproteobacteria bacterium]MBW2070395.1 4Fe-4S binding protein [Deltaproteobacteria bacterium]
MKDTIKEYVANLFAEGKIKGFLALREHDSHVGPHLFTKAEELDSLSLADYREQGDSRYPLDKILTKLAHKYPTDTFAVLVRGCDERGLQQLFAVSKLHRDRVIPVGFCCPSELAQKHGCWKPYPDAAVAGEPALPFGGDKAAATTGVDILAELQEWFDTFDRCVKCYGCRNICPVCYCDECTLEEASLIPRGEIPPANPNFLMTRAIHMVGRSLCIYCGLCEEVCPADIPLKSLYKLVAKVMGQEAETPEAKAATHALATEQTNKAIANE